MSPLKKYCLILDFKGLLLCFLLSFIALVLTCSSLFHFVLIFEYAVK